MTTPETEGPFTQNSETNKSETLSTLSADSAVLSSYFASSCEFYDTNNIPIQDTTWNSETGEFTLDFKTPKYSQAYEGICHGGFTAMLIDSILRLPILGKKYNKEDFTDELFIKYMRKVEVGATIRVVGKIDSVNEKHVKIFAQIVDISKPTKVLARGSLSVNEKDQSNTSNQSENKQKEVVGKTLQNISEDQTMLKNYLLSSQEFYHANNIPISEAVWNEEDGELILDIETSVVNQGEAGVCQIGYISTLLDSIAGFPIFLKSINEGKIALSDELTIRSFNNIKIGEKIRVIGRIDSIDGKKSKSSAIVIDMSDSSKKILAEGSLTMNIIYI